MRHFFSLKRIVVSLVLVTQAAYPLTATAGNYLQLVPIRGLQVATGSSLPSTNTDPSNTTSTVTTAGRAALKVAPSSIDFGQVSAGSQSPIQTVMLSNLGAAPLILGTLSVNDQFLVTDNCNGAVLPSLGTCPVNVAFAPTQVAPGGLIGTVSIPFNAGGAQNTGSLALQAVATAPDSSNLPSASLEGFSGGGTNGLSISAQGDHQIDFGSTLQGRESVSKSFIVRSNGTAPVSYNGVVVSPNDSAFSATSTCGTTIAAGAGCWVTVTFAPGSTVSGPQTASLSVKTTSIVGNSMPVSLTGFAQSDSSFSLPSLGLNVGDVAVNATGTTSFLVLNTGTTPLTSPVISATGSFYSVAHACPTTLASGSSCSVTVSFAPLTPASVGGSVSVQFQEAATQTLSVQAQGTGPLLSVDAVNQSFGTVVPGSSTTLTYTVSNTGNAVAPLTVSAPPAGVTDSSDCGATLAAGAACQLRYTYAPQTQGSVSGTVIVTSTLNTLNLTFSGQAVGLPSFSVSSTTVDFGNAQVNASVSQSIQVTNTGPVVLNTPSIQVLGSAFDVSHNCAASLTPGNSCQALISFTPTARQSYGGSLSVSYSGVAAQTVSLSGVSESAVLAAAPATLSFGSVNIGASSSLTSTITNSGNLATALAYSGLPPDVTRGGTCINALGAGATCTVILEYVPASTATTSGTMTVTGTNTNVAIAYNGTGVVVPPTDAQVSNVSLLIHGDSPNAGTNKTFLDSSPANSTITPIGAPTQGSYGPGAGMSSGQFGGTDSLSTTIPAIGAGDYTVEFWMNTNAARNQYYVVLGTDWGDSSGIQVIEYQGNIAVVAGSLNNNAVTSARPANTWNHVAIVRKGTATGNLKVYLNGVAVSTTTDNTTLSATALRIGHGQVGHWPALNGYISNFRAVAGTAVYSANFTPPATAPLTSIPGTRVLLNFANGAVTDAVGKINLKTVGGAAVSTAVSKFGGGSIAFNGTDSYITIPANANIAYGSGNFTTEMWVYKTANNPNSARLWNPNCDCVDGLSIGINSLGQVVAYASTGGTAWDYAATTGALANNTWYHIAVVRNGGSLVLYLNGVGTSMTNSLGTAALFSYAGERVIGGQAASPFRSLTGYVDEVRHTKGVARYTGNFATPSAPFPN